MGVQGSGRERERMLIIVELQQQLSVCRAINISCVSLYHNGKRTGLFLVFI